MNTNPLVADGEQPRSGGADRKIVDVAVGILIRPDGSFLLTSRPEGKVYAGYWEIPGGKLEAGEALSLTNISNPTRRNAISNAVFC